MPPKKKIKSDYIKADWKRKRQNKKRKDGGKKEREGDDSRGAGYRDIVKENELFVKYYQGLGFIDEWDEFITTMREPLPATFRITGTRLMAEHVLTCLQRRYFGELAEMVVEGEKVPPPKPLAWYPNNFAWHVPLTRKFIRKSPLMSKFHSFLVKENEQGNISRQEAVSMIPPLLLDVRPHHKVLDMCAAPGSKTAQLIEALHAEDSQESTIPAGVVIANDADNKRCYMLIHQAKRLNSPCFIVTNHDASVFPMFYYHDEEDVRHPLFYDRVLCDVPCSGDGTLRKNPIIWREWNPSVGLSLHKLQLRILTRGLELLAPGGRLVYSTCSLNPVENEAVIATMLSLCKGFVQLVDCTECLPGLKRIPGLTSWKIMSKKGEWYSSVSELPESSQLPPTLFPPPPTDPLHTQLPKCMRVLPHHQNTGGFFIAVLEKTEWLPWQKQRKTTTEADPESEKVVLDSQTPIPYIATDPQDTSAEVSNPSQDTEGVSQDTSSTPQDEAEKKEKEEDERPSKSVLGKPAFQQRRSHGYKEDPFVFLPRDSDVQQTVAPYYGLPESFPFDQLLTRSVGGKRRNIYLSSKLVKELTIRNEHVVKIINIGIRLLSRYDHQRTSCTFRICQEGVESILPYVTSRSVPMTQSDLVMVLSQPNPLTTELSQLAQDALELLDLGPVLFKYSPPPATDAVATCSDSDKFVLTCPMSLSGWRAGKSVRLFVDKVYRYHFLSMLGEEPQENQSLECVTPASRVGGVNEDTEEDDLTHTEMEHPPSEGKPLDDKSSISKQDGDSGDGCERENGPPGMDTRVDTGVDTTEMETGMETEITD
ncbi:RNA cytosine-C(5)-methyltransferase NSUN2-like isoform X2 [Halichondria panicea]|uniref:RNA cytosine-C(5)-methyltransferase NSUN2-like isoform X2 n=1 Tax=Halichondria panicea TaxID=6063 RepID=UPI00312B3D6F